MHLDAFFGVVCIADIASVCSFTSIYLNIPRDYFSACDAGVCLVPYCRWQQQVRVAYEQQLCICLIKNFCEVVMLLSG